MKNRVLVIAGIVAAFAAAVLAIVFWPSSSSGPVPIARGVDACDKCHMVISEPNLAAEMRSATGAVTKYDDPGCLVAALSSKKTETPDAWVEDFDGGGFVPALKATWVKGARVQTPMGYGLIAFASRERAEAFVAEKGGAVVPFESLLRTETVAAFTELEAQLGRPIYERECSSCHGMRGDGQGTASLFLDPKPRDFTRRQFKIRTTESGKAPRSADVLATIENGMPGSAMPGFASALTPDERRKAGAYVMKLAGYLGKPEPAPIADPGDAPDATPESIARGQKLFGQMLCVNCHGPEGRGDGVQSAGLKDALGNTIRPRDFTSGKFRGGNDPTSLYYRIVGGVDGTPMAPYGDTIESKDDRWALVHFVKSLEKPVATPVPENVIAAGRAIADEFGCRGCHVLDDGKGGDIGPDMRLIGKKLDPAWIQEFLSDPRAAGKIYPWRPHRMPDLKLSGEQAETMSRYFAAIGGRKAPPVDPDASTFTKVAEGKGVFVLRCAQCHALGTEVQTPLASQQGPDLVRASQRLDYDWMKPWILDPKSYDPKTKMSVPGVTAEEAEAVRQYIWKTSKDLTADPKRAER